MAFFERADERDRRVLCNICNVLCNEKSMMTHRVKCTERHPDKLAEGGSLKKCEFDSGHIVEADKMDLHLEFCTKRQTEIVAEFQRMSKVPEISPIIPESSPWAPARQEDQIDDDWNRAAADDKSFIMKMKNMKLK